MAVEPQAPVEYGWGAGSKKSGEAQPIGLRLEALARRHGPLTAELVLKAAEPERALLHRYFEWDDELAAHSHRLSQAGALIRAVVIIRDAEEKPPVRAFWLVTEESERSYRPVYAVLSDAALRAQVLARALRELAEWRVRYENLAELADVIAIIDRSIDENGEGDGENGKES